MAAASTTTSTNGTFRQAASAPTATPAGRAHPANPEPSVADVGVAKLFLLLEALGT